MADVTVKYKGNVIAEMSEESTKTLKTSGKYCEGDISVSYTPPAGSGETEEVRSKVYTFTLAKKSGWVELVTLDADVLAHINDATLKVMLCINDAYSYVNYSGCCYVATNTAFAKSSSYPVYGYAHRQAAETTNQNTNIFYPANNTGTSESLGGNGIFRVNGSKYYIKPGDGYIRNGTYTLVFTW